MKTKTLILFLVLTFSIGWLFQGLAIAGGVTQKGSIWLMAAMWAPILAALLAGAETRRSVWTRIRQTGWKLWPVALLVGFSFCIIQQLLLLAGRQGRWNDDFFRLSGNGQSIDSIHHVATLLGTGHQTFGFFALNLFLTISLASVILMFTGGIGEEGGWRGVLQPEMERRWGPFKGTLLVGLVWGYWHLPVNLAAYNGARHPILQALLLFQVGTIAMSFALAWLVRWSGSVWPAALAHAANNVLQSGTLIVPGNWGADQVTGVLASVLVGVACAWLLIRRNSRMSGIIGSTAKERSTGLPNNA
ncbi:MAG: CPBP family intramembrane glutamic endopeptidase [Candidatus Acidiferrales bacterium]